ncbi:FAD-dependent monooxygenase [Thermasporomyces composti]|jgi:2-polyprenyl-6-methoxyphenol hydroxylase-like FAD-dependent oxidoreductase|uniref:2-polyprenyl-6-methoxyphenol hydroxylase-like FAD-dependent oxidoreductase n=1 Tax=Thermasporomyces composti TaxID=696763 RepID=A0A3D9V4H2_THECX|nr:FAD-dependent monooxygenase [Thermasporomyces composti]REF36266.1 2-polyprenyl-6-methoxyphenol hydroxylase-like FAD-dependent oxidoreductase [Thermasporomyces composti]
MKAVVVGGGIGGLAAAVALERRGWEVEILEQAAELTAVGAGLSLWPNAVRALDRLGLGEVVRQRALLGVRGGIQDTSGRWLARTDTDELERRFGTAAVVHRADLVEALRAALSAASLRTGVTVHAAHPDGTVLHSAGSSSGDLVVGADGVRSVVRQSVWPHAPAPRYVGYSAWRMLTRPMAVDEAVETWGRGERFGYAPLSDGRVYCFAVANAREGAAHGGLAELRRRFGGWHEPIPALLDAVDDSDLLYHDIYDLPPLSSYVSGRVVLLGDAAHAMTPDLGQGACQALEDAVVLGDCLDLERPAAGDVEHAMVAYDEARRPRAQTIARRSRQVGAVAQWSARPAVLLRNTALRLLPRSVFARSQAPVLSWPG